MKTTILLKTKGFKLYHPKFFKTHWSVWNKFVNFCFIRNDKFDSNAADYRHFSSFMNYTDIVISFVQVLLWYFSRSSFYPSQLLLGGLNLWLDKCFIINHSRPESFERLVQLPLLLVLRNIWLTSYLWKMNWKLER